MLSGEKIKLRALEPEDIDLLMAWENNTENWYLSGTVQPYSRAVLKNYLEHARQDIYHAGQLRLVVEVNETQQAVGTIDVFDFDAFHQRAGIGILIGNAIHRGKGYGKEALQLLTEYAFQYLGLRQLYCNVLAQNKSSLKLFKSAGFVQSGIKKAWIRRGEEFEDELFLQLIK